jgi:hypothetical protein
VSKPSDDGQKRPNPNAKHKTCGNAPAQTPTKRSKEFAFVHKFLKF